jgi:hypothetical protein
MTPRQKLASQLGWMMRIAKGQARLVNPANPLELFTEIKYYYPNSTGIAELLTDIAGLDNKISVAKEKQQALVQCLLDQINSQSEWEHKNTRRRNGR